MSVISTTWIFATAVAAAGLPTTPTVAQEPEETSVGIELGSSRIGGPGLTKAERQQVKAYNTPDRDLNEQTLPPPGHRRRLASLHTLAERYSVTRQWKEACQKYDSILEEFEEAGLDSKDEARRLAGRAFFHCGRTTAMAGDHEKAEKLLTKSEKYAPTTPKHAAVREKMLRDQYRKKMMAGDYETALSIFEKAQAMREDEDQRIWIGEKLAEMAWDAHKSGDKVLTKVFMGKLETIAPLNTEYRRLKDEIEGQAAIFKNALLVAGAVMTFLVLWQLYARWSARRKVRLFEAHTFDDL